MDEHETSLLPEDHLWQIGDPYFDSALAAWVVTRHSEVAQVLHDPRFIPAIAGAPATAQLPETQPAVDVRRARMKAAAEQMMIRLNRALPQTLSRTLLIPATIVECDFVTDVLKPLCISLAGSSVENTSNTRCGALADEIFTASAYPYNLDLQKVALSAITELNASLGPASAIAVQTFVALATSLPAFLATAWALLLSNRDEWQALQQNSALAPLAIEECLRLAGLPGIQFRQAARDVILNGIEIEKHQNMLLIVQRANRDPTVFSDPESFRINRRHNPHLSFGRGGHSCIGAHMVRAIGQALLVHLTTVIRTAELTETPRWEGFAIRFLETLPVRLEMRDPQLA